MFERISLQRVLYFIGHSYGARFPNWFPEFFRNFNLDGLFKPESARSCILKSICQMSHMRQLVKEPSLVSIPYKIAR